MTDLLERGSDDVARTAERAREWGAGQGCAAAPASVVFYRCDPETPRHAHDLRTKAEIAKAIARLLGCRFAERDCAGDDVEACARAGDGPRYLVPSHTLIGMGLARRLGIRGLRDFFGGIVPHAFAETKAITHTLIGSGAAAPDGWSYDHGDLIRSVVLPGYTAFSIANALSGAVRLLAHGAVRLKPAGAVGGAGQVVVHDALELKAYFDQLNGDVSDGLILERNLADAMTCSIGHVQVGEHLASYVGTQFQTTNGQGHTVYGGSDLRVVRGGFETLLELDLEPELRIAVVQALHYHAAAVACYPGLMASRCNYDVVQGLDDDGHWRSGVLEQSWRVGGASGAEIAALQALRDDPGLAMVHASTREVYGERAAEQVPDRAWILFDGVDRHDERLLKYVQVHTDGLLALEGDALT
ncbi:MAG TPA: DUF3182 family protein [Burkholderiaceae bacterium]|nr:DUF3182 family protein [Burkholderiaceae bacterium]